MAVLVTALPGLLLFQAFPVSAATVQPPALFHGPPDTPDQLTGSAAGFPSLVETAATTTTVKVKPSKQEDERPKRALQTEGRFVDEPQPAATRKSTDADKRSASSEAARAQALDCQYGCIPTIVDVHPWNEAQVGSLTPLLVTYAKSNAGVYGIDYFFEICDRSGMSGTCTTSGWLSDVNTWRVPAGKLKWGKEYWWQVSAKDRGTLGVNTSLMSSITTGVRQPMITSQLSARGVNGQEFHQLSGNYTTAFTDASVTTAGEPLSVVRSYNTLDPRADGMFGAAWSTLWDMKLVSEVGGETSSLLATYPDGRQVRFAPNGDGTFQPPPGMHATLATVSGGGWRLMDKSATSYHFDAQGRLTKITDARSRSRDLVYGTDGKLATVTATGGRALHFTWTGAHVTQVSTDPVGGQALTWTYQYQGDRLVASCAPVAAPNCTTYGYGTGSTYRSTVLDSEPYGYWRLGETSGTWAADLGWGAGPATYVNATKGQPGALAGTTDTAISVTSGSVELPLNSVARLADKFSVEVWFKTTLHGVLFSAGLEDPTPADSAIYVGTDGKLRARSQPFYGDNAAPITSAGVVNDGQWHHAVLSVSGPTDRLYLDGQLVGSLTGSGGIDWREQARFGKGMLSWRWPATSESFRGQLDEVALYDKPLTAQEISRHHAARAETPHKLTTITLPSGRAWAANTYDAATDRITTHVDQHGGTWKIGAPVYAPEPGTSTITVTDPNNNTLGYVHDAWRGYRLVSRTDQLGKITRYGYDTGGFLTKVTDPNGVVIEQVNDARGNVTATKTCKAAGNCQTTHQALYRNSANEFDPRNDRPVTYRDARSANATDNTYATTIEYTPQGEVAKQTTPATSDFPTGRSTTYTYTDGTEPAIGGGTTPAGLTKSVKDAKNNEITYRYNTTGDLAEQTSPSGLITKFAYDALGRVTSQTEVSAAHPTGVTTTFTYDGTGRLLTQTAPGVKNEVNNVTHTAKATYTYNPDGDTLTETVADLTGGDATRTTTYTYDPKGRVETITDPEGGMARSTWDSTGAQVSATNQLGTVFAYGYTKRGELASTTIKNWTGSPLAPKPAQDVVLEARSYDNGGRLGGRVDAMGRKTLYTYFTDNRLSEVIGDDVRLNGLTTTTDVVLEANTYDAAGNLVKQVTDDPAGQDSGGEKVTTDYVYDAAGRLTSSTFDPVTLKRKTAYTYDAVGNITKETFTGAASARTESTTYTYNALSLMTQRTVENGAEDLVATHTYDDRGLLTATTDPRGNASGANAADFTTTLRYDLAGQLVETKAPQVTIEKNGTATAGRPTVRYGYNSVGLTTHAVDGEGRTSTAAFDKAGRLTSTTSAPYTPPGGATLIPKISYGYDAAGQLTSVTNERDYVTTATYDALGRAVRVTDPGPSGPGGAWTSEYDMLGEELATVDPTGARSEATYDDLGRQITATRIERKPTTAAHTTTLTYDTAGNLTKAVAPGNKTTNYVVNAAGQPTSISDPLTHASTFGYDILGRTTKVTDPLNNATEAEYDLAGRQIAAKDLNSSNAVVRTFGFGYDLAGNPTSTTSGEGRITRRTFDAASRMTSLIEPVATGTSITSTFGYDATSAHTRITDGRGNATWTSYNTLGLVESVIEPATTAYPNAADRTWTSLYDAAGNATATLQPGGVRIDRTFDHLDRLTTQTGSGASVATPARNFTYDSADRLTAVGDYTLEYNDRSLLTKVSKAANQVATYAYDASGNPTQRVDPTGTATYTWDAADRLKTASDPVTGRTWTYGYDNADRLTTKTSASPVSTQTYGYDTVNRLTSHSVKNSSGTELAKIAYGWDKDDNLTSKTTTGTAGAGVNTYGYDHAGRLTSWTAPGGATTSYTWDESGNRTGAGSDTFVYDQRNRLISGAGTDYTYTPRGTTATETKAGTTRNLTFDAFDRLVSDGEAGYGYDALGRVTSRTKGAEQRRFVYSGLENDIATVADGANATLAKYGRDPFGGLLSLQEGAAPALATMTDLHGDVVGTFSGTALVDSVAYDPFGKPIHRSGTPRGLGYQGEYTDPDTGKVNMHARWYQPGTGAFTSRDDWTLNPQPSVQANRYTYGNASPLVSVDPSGHYPVLPPITGGGRGPVVAPPAPKPPIIPIPLPVFPMPNTNKSPTTAPSPTTGKGTSTGANPNSGRGSNPDPGKGSNPDINRNGGGRYIATATSSTQSVTIRNNTGTAPPRVSPQPPTKKPEPYKPDFDPNSPEFINDPNNAENPIYQRTPQEEKDYYCTYLGPCIYSYTGHVGTEIQGDGGRGGGGGGGTSCEQWDPERCGKDSCGKYVGFVYSTSVFGCVPGSDKDIGNGTARSQNFPTDNGSDSYPETPPAPPTFCPSGNSFVPGTKVLMADGTTKPIEDVKIGDWVVAADAATGLTAARRVSHLITGDGEKRLVRLTITTDAATGKSGTVVATDGHPFWVPDLRKWVKAGELQPGMLLRTSAGTYIQLTAVKKWTAPQRVHNLTVDGLHTYHVVAGNQAILAHNDDPFDVALGYRIHGTEKFANDRGLQHFLDLGPTEWQAPVQKAIVNGKIVLHVNTRGFSGDFTEMAMRGLRRDKNISPYATEEEMGWIARAVANERRTWDSVRFYDDSGDVVNVPEPDWDSFGRLRDLPC
ncbi:LamG-like jellyroll fold domain-containing protein [Streptosporangium sp. NPDC050280]|uniref:LamG-like jellyroll fold domain-containing protein n=1 Tax=unclassified Streptosporangium TaxID=2632669 RepID=UPI003420678A